MESFPAKFIPNIGKKNKSMPITKNVPTNKQHIRNMCLKPKETQNPSATNLKRRKLIDLSANERLEVVKMASKKDISYE